jgi:hypothetical protein
MLMEIMKKIGVGVMKTAAAKFSAFEFFRQRDIVSNTIEAELKLRMLKFGV